MNKFHFFRATNQQIKNKMKTTTVKKNVVNETENHKLQNAKIHKYFLNIYLLLQATATFRNLIIDSNVNFNFFFNTNL